MLSVVKSLERFNLERFIFPEILFMEQPSEYGLEFFFMKDSVVCNLFYFRTILTIQHRDVPNKKCTIAQLEMNVRFRSIDRTREVKEYVPSLWMVVTLQTSKQSFLHFLIFLLKNCVSPTSFKYSFLKCITLKSSKRECSPIEVNELENKGVNGLFKLCRIASRGEYSVRSRIFRPIS